MNAVEGAGIIFGIAAVYLVITTVVGVWSVKYAKDTNSFMSAKNQMGVYIVGILLVSEFIAAASTLGTSQAAFDKGISASWNFITLAIGFVLYSYLLAGKYNETGEYTISGILNKKYGNNTRMVVSLIMVYALMTVNVVAYTAGAVVVASLLGIPTTPAVLIISAAATACVAAGGIRGVGFANLIHFLFKYFAIVVTAAVAWSMLKQRSLSLDTLPAMHFSMTGIGIPTIIAWTIGNIGAVFSTQYVIQTISSLSSAKDAKKASLFASFWLLPLGFIAAYIGLAAKVLFPTIKSVQALPEFLKYMNPWLAGIVVSGILAVAFVTMLACNIGSTALVMKDFYIPLVKPSEKRQIVAVRIIAVVLGLLPIPFALYVPALLKTVFFARALRTSVAVVALFMFYAPRIGNNTSAALGLTLSIVFTTVWFAMNNPFGIDNMYIALGTPIIAMLIGQIFKKDDQRAVLQRGRGLG
jgi:solute:Na+ symporter, SSS family